MHSHHSHSGQYCGHAKDQLEQVILEAVRQKFKVFALTEHVPRFKTSHFYPEEEADGYTVERLNKTFESYKAHARRIQKQYEEKLCILVGCEIESIDPDSWEYALTQKPALDFIVGSVHHVAEIPIDYSHDLWNQAMATVSQGNSVEDMFKSYFDLQYQMLKATHPQVIGHFDLIRLMAPKNFDNCPFTRYPEVWDKVCRNIDYAIAYGGLFEINAAALRKGWDTPYPQRDVAEYIIQNGGRFCLSDDSHGVSQIGLNYSKCIQYLEGLGVGDVWYLTRDGDTVVARSEKVGDFKVAL